MTSVLSQPGRVKSPDMEDRDSTGRYMALALNVALLTGIIFVVAVFFALLVSFVVYRRRQRHQHVTRTQTSSVAQGVSRPRIKPAYDGFAPVPAPIYPPDNKTRLFTSVSKVGDPKEWFV